MVKFRTVDSNESEFEKCRHYIKDYFSDSELIVREHESNGKTSVVILNKDTSEPEIMLHGHYDVVNGKEELFEPEMEENRLYGRGTADMKAGLACMMRVMKDLESSNVSVMLAATPDEEIGGLDGTKYLVDEHYTPSFGISAEPNNVEGTYMDIIAKQKGFIKFNISLEEPLYHSTKPWLGTDAADKLARKYVEISNMFADPDEREWSTTYFLNSMSSGEDDINPNQAEITFSVYNTRDYPIEEIKEDIKDFEDIDVEVLFEQSVLDTDYENEYVENLLKAMKSSIHEVEPEATWKAPMSDMGHLYEKGIPAVVFGPEGYNSHGDEEYAVVSSFDEYMDSLRKFAEILSK